MLAAAVFFLVFVPMLVEAAISRRNERLLRSLNAQEPRQDVYATMQIAYPAAFLVMIVEGWWRHIQVDVLFGAGLAVLVAAKVLKYWAIVTLGYRWTFRVLVPPDSKRIRSGPYRVFDHPNYIAVAGELIGVALMMRAGISGPLATLFFGFLLMRRIAIEERVLRGEQ